MVYRSFLDSLIRDGKMIRWWGLKRVGVATATLNFVDDLRRFSILPVLGNTRIARRRSSSGTGSLTVPTNCPTGLASPGFFFSQIS